MRDIFENVSVETFQNKVNEYREAGYVVDKFIPHQHEVYYAHKEGSKPVVIAHAPKPKKSHRTVMIVSDDQLDTRTCQPMKYYAPDCDLVKNKTPVDDETSKKLRELIIKCLERQGMDLSLSNFDERLKKEVIIDKLQTFNVFATDSEKEPEYYSVYTLQLRWGTVAIKIKEVDEATNLTVNYEGKNYYVAVMLDDMVISFSSNPSDYYLLEDYSEEGTFALMEKDYYNSFGLYNESIYALNHIEEISECAEGYFEFTDDDSPYSQDDELMFSYLVDTYGFEIKKGEI